MNDRIIFLDIDGVLNSKNYIRSNTMVSKKISFVIDPNAVENLNKLIEKTNAKIVISSSWRIMADLKEIKQILEEHGFTGEIIGETPYLKDMYAVRGNEIKAWLKENKSFGYNQYIIIDDDSDMLLEHAEHFIHTDFDSGLTETLAYRAMLKLLKFSNWEKIIW